MWSEWLWFRNPLKKYKKEKFYLFNAGTRREYLEAKKRGFKMKLDNPKGGPNEKEKGRG